MNQQEFEEMQALAIGALKDGNQDANSKLSPMLDTFECYSQFQFLLENSQDQYALFFAAKGLEQLINKFWTKYEKEFKVAARIYLLSYLASKGPNILQSFPSPHLGPFITDTICTIVARMTKYGWFEDPCYKEIVTDAKKFLNMSSGTLYYIGLRLLNAVGDNMNTQTGGQTITTHRKVAVSFRDNSLLEAFVQGVECLRQINSGTLAMTEVEQELNNEAAPVLILCSLSFDFIGTNMEEGEDVNTVQVPTAWKPYIQDSWLLNTMFQYYAEGVATNAPPKRLTVLLESIVQLASVRRTLFETDVLRQEFLRNILKGILAILKDNVGLDENNCHHQLCRLIGRLRVNYSLTDLVKIPECCEWMQQVCNFTLTTIKDLSLYMNGSQYLLAMWARMVALLPNITGNMLVDVNVKRCIDTLKLCVNEISRVYVEVAMQCAYSVADGSDDDLLDGNTEGTVREQMEKFAGMIHAQYEVSAGDIFKRYEECLHAYNNPGLSGQELVFVESKLAWLTNFVSSIIYSSLASPSQERLICDGPLCSRVFAMLGVLGSRSSSGRSDYIPLEKSILYFFRTFRKVYMMESGQQSISTIVSSFAGNSTSSAMPLLAAVLSAQSSKPVEEDKTIYTAMNIGDLHFIMNQIIVKLCSNINSFTGGNGSETNVALDETLEVFIELITNYASSKMLLELPTVQGIIGNHTGETFPFLGYTNNNKHRIKFYAALMRLVFTSSEDINNSFDLFIAPNIAMLDQLTSVSNLSASVEIKYAILGVLRDFRGIAEATYTKRTYNLLFDALYPNYFPLLSKIAESYALDIDVTTALLKFMMEFVHNKASRITFELSSANGILLFQETSRIVCIISKQVMDAPLQNQSAVYQEKYKSIRLLLSLLINALSGNYVNFGVFALYGDKCLEEAMTIALQICLRIPNDHILEYVKLSKAYFGFVECLFRSHLDVVVQIDSENFIKLLGNNLAGLESSDPAVAQLCAQTFDHMTTYIFLNANKREKATLQKIFSHIGTAPDILNDYMMSLFQVLILNSSTASAYSLTRPILSLLLANEASFHYVKSSLVSVQTSPENQGILDAEFNKLLEDIQQSLETSNRDKFTQKLNAFKNNVREFLTFS